MDARIVDSSFLLIVVLNTLVGVLSQGSHVDLPGQHGNFEPVPVVHRERIGAPHFGGGGSHVDLPGQHGNIEPVPIVHREGGGAIGGGGSHVDLPGQHGNLEPVPIVHREGHGAMIGGGGSHVDLPGQHGNLEPVPTVHREGAGSMIGSGGSHVDLPGQHGNFEPVPIVHRQGGFPVHGIVPGWLNHGIVPGIGVGSLHLPGAGFIVDPRFGTPGRFPGFRRRGHGGIGLIRPDLGLSGLGDAIATAVRHAIG